LENTFRHVNIALVNELAMFARDLGIDVWEAIDAASTKPFGYMRFTPGPGVGGHCLPIDPSYLSWQVERSLGQTFRFVELANDINEHMPDYVVRRVQALLNDQSKAVKGSSVLVFGLAYKANTSDARETVATDRGAVARAGRGRLARRPTRGGFAAARGHPKVEGLARRARRCRRDPLPGRPRRLRR
jgi:nucleotide sugar dehydrogenase